MAGACCHGPVRGNIAAGAGTSYSACRQHPDATVADGIIAIREGKFREAVAIWTPYAEAGNPAANYGLGLIYSRDRGAGMPARPELSHRHYKAAAAHKGHVDSVFELAFQYERGIGTKANTDHALAFYRIAATKNHLNAQYNLAVLLSRGGDVKPTCVRRTSGPAAKNNARIRPRGELTLEKVSRLTQMIRDRLPPQTASKAGLAATRLTGQPI